MDVLIVAATSRELQHMQGARKLRCGIGPVEAAAATARELALRPADALVHIGVAGARGLAVGTLVLGAEAVYEDVAAAVPVVDRARPDAALLERVRQALPQPHVLPIGTSARVGGTTTCTVEAMEGFAVLRAAELAGVAAVELRAISNEIGEPDRSRWHMDEALAALGHAVSRVLAALSD